MQQEILNKKSDVTNHMLKELLGYPIEDVGLIQKLSNLSLRFLMKKSYIIYYRRVLILKEIKEIQPYLSSYYQTTKMVLESKFGTLGEDDQSQAQVIGQIQRYHL